jgi:hypothetical protein
MPPKIYLSSGGEGGIRTHGRIAPTPVFKTGAFNRSATSPISLKSTLYSALTGRRRPIAVTRRVPFLLNQGLEPDITRLHSVLHAGRKHGGPRFGIGQGHSHGHQRAGAA